MLIKIASMLIHSPGYRLNEYLLVISPNEDLRARIARIKKNFADEFSAQTAFYRPHLTLAKFVTWEMQEEKLVTRFRHTAMGISPFKVLLKDFGSFPSHTVYINVATRLPVQELSRQLRTAQKLMKAHPDYDPHFLNEPHITIARKLKPWQYEKGWLKYSHERFTATMVADAMLLLKRPLERPPGHHGYQVVQGFDFLNMPVSTRQGELFPI